MIVGAELAAQMQAANTVFAQTHSLYVIPKSFGPIPNPEYPDVVIGRVEDISKPEKEPPPRFCLIPPVTVGEFKAWDRGLGEDRYFGLRKGGWGGTSIVARMRVREVGLDGLVKWVRMSVGGLRREVWNGPFSSVQPQFFDANDASPAFVSWDAAALFAAWHGGRLMTAREYTEIFKRAVAGSPLRESGFVNPEMPAWTSSVAKLDWVIYGAGRLFFDGMNTRGKPRFMGTSHTFLRQPGVGFQVVIPHPILG